jgi:hypothetical protein
MTRMILISVLLGTVLAGFEGAADAAGPGMPVGQDHGHELHDSAHTGDHEQGDVADHDDHFCHCGMHSLALVPVIITPLIQKSSRPNTRYDRRVSSHAGPPLLRPPKS